MMRLPYGEFLSFTTRLSHWLYLSLASLNWTSLARPVIPARLLPVLARQEARVGAGIFHL